MFAMATSIRRAQHVYACLNPLGDPGDPSKPINPNFFVPPASSVQCMQVGSNNLAVDLTTAFGPDNQPYFGGQRIVNAPRCVNSFDSQPAERSKSAWPNCIWQTQRLRVAGRCVRAPPANGCGNAAAELRPVSAP